MSAVPQLEATLTALASSGPDRAAAEEHLDLLLASKPGQTILGLVQIGAQGQDEAKRAFAFVLFRRLCFRQLHQDVTELYNKQAWDQLSQVERSQVQAGLLQCLQGADKRREHERGVICDAVAEVEKAGIARQSECCRLRAPIIADRSATQLAGRNSLPP